ncbi:MAG TPA: elongation factor G [Candidatus Cybelea sp.]|nr:elongation factor G [Candidatus Cybelea sp.]
MSDRKPSGPRSVALVGPYLSGKTTLLESILLATGAIPRKGSVTEKSSVGDASIEARERQMSVEVNCATTTFLDDTFTFLDCPGSIEFLQETLNALIGIDAAVVVCEPEADKVLSLGPLLKMLDDRGIPHFIFVNKIDKASGLVRDLLASLQAVSAKPLVLRQVPIREGEHVTGYVDLASERAYVYKDDAPSAIVEIPADMKDRKAEARYAMLEKLADFDDKLMEALLEEREPSRDIVFADLSRDLQEGLIVPVLLGAADTGHGVRRLLKALRHEVPAHNVAAERVGIDAAQSEPIAQVLKTYVTPHGGKLTLVRVWSGTIKDGAVLNGERAAGLFRLKGAHTDKIAQASAGEIVAIGRLESARTGDTLGASKEPPEQLPKAERLPPVFGLAIHAANRNDEVKISAAMGKLLDEDPSLSFEQNSDTHQFVLRGQGDIHLRVAFSKLKSKYGLAVDGEKPKVAYKEAIRRSATQHGRHKRQSGGHGQFGDVHIEIKPLPRGSGFAFENKIVGGVVPRNFIPAVEEGVKEYLKAGPMGFPVVDVAVALYDGSYHAVDSSEMAFKTAGRIAMTEGMPKCDPVLLEPICKIDITVPSEFTSKVNGLISGRRGQILGFDARPNWPGWDVVTAYMPAAEMHDLIIELRSLTQGVGSFTYTYDRLQELTGRLADQVLAARAAE